MFTNKRLADIFDAIEQCLIKHVIKVVTLIILAECNLFSTVLTVRKILI